jgi:UDP:flavonoid glycosyltransferase YjiC (YdhE family)
MKLQSDNIPYLELALKPLLVHDVFLVAPLNWGLGHAARCIPIIDQLLFYKKKIVLASDGDALHLLQKTYPHLPYYELPSYGITYPYNSILRNVLKNSRNIFSGIRAENSVLKQILTKEKIAVILSDNRYGLHHPDCINIFICHQIKLIHPNILVKLLGSFIHKMMIKRFTTCWIPDLPPPNSLAPAMSIPSESIQHRYIGILSRMKPQKQKIIRKYLVILSGPEPKRTELEQLLMNCLNEKSFLLVRGKPSPNNSYKNGENIIDFMAHLSLEKEIGRSEMIICRSGYTSIMDLINLNKKAILIPTPGQSEQEYLAKRMALIFPDTFVTLSQNEVENFDW